jgi:hypothetical protein
MVEVHFYSDLKNLYRSPTPPLLALISSAESLDNLLKFKQDFGFKSQIPLRLANMVFAFLPGRGTQMKKYIQRLVLGFAIASPILVFQNCSKISISDITDDGSNGLVQNTPDTPHATCTDGRDITKPTKIFLMVDASLSNISDPSDNNRIGTDDNKVWRSKVLKQVIARYGNNPHISFGLISFKGYTNDVTAHIHAPGSNQAIFTNDMAAVQAGVDDFMKVVEGAGTPYPAAVNSAHETIKADLDAHPGENATYEIVMLTDGISSSNSYDYSRYHNGALATAAKETQAIMDLSPNMIHFNGVLYFNDSNPLPPAGTDLDPRLVLNQMVETGQGVFLIANTQPEYDFNIDTVLKFEPAQCQ